MALFVNDETAVIWRGPMVTKLETEFLFNVEWGDLDCLVLDLPARHRRRATDDHSAGRARRRRDRHDAAGNRPARREARRRDVRRGQGAGTRRGREHELPPLPQVRESARTFRTWRRRARSPRRCGVPFLGELPITGELREGGDTANPLVAVHPDHPVSEAFKAIAANVIAHLSQPATKSRSLDHEPRMIPLPRSWPAHHKA